MKPFDLDELVLRIEAAYEHRVYGKKGIDAVEFTEMKLKQQP
jgi:DNA-binding response OmpR family regulator